MARLKNGWLGIVLVSVFVSLVITYVLSAYLFKIGNGLDASVIDAVQQPIDIYQYITNEENLKIIIPFVPIFALGIMLYFLRKNLINENYSDAADYGLHGTAKWANPESLLNGKVLADKSESTYKKDLKYNLEELKTGYILGKVPNTKKLLIMHEQADVSNQNIIVIGSSGSSKTQSYVIPNLVNVDDKSIIVTDPKGELFNMTSQLKKDQGYKIYQVDFISFMQSKYNPLSYVETTLQAQKVANTIISNFEGDGGDNVFFKNSATNMLAALIIYVKAEFPPEEANMEQVVNVYTDYVQNEETFDEWVKTIPDDHPAKEMLNSITDLTGNTRGSVTSTLNNGLNIFKLPQVKHMTRRSDFHFQDFVDEKSILYVKLSMEDDTFAPLTSVFFSQMINNYYDLAAQSPDQKLKRKVVFMLDEFANIGKIDNYSRTLATCRSLGLSMHTIIQNKSQLEKKSMYGAEETNDILSNHDTTILLRAKQEDTDTTKWISDALGQTTKEVEKESVAVSSQGKTVTKNKEHVERPLMTQAEIGSLDKTESIVIIAGQNPLFLHKAFQFEIYQDLISKEVNGDFVSNYVNKRHELGYTTPLMEEMQHDKVEEQKLSDYQRQKAAEKARAASDEQSEEMTNKQNEDVEHQEETNEEKIINRANLTDKELENIKEDYGEKEVTENNIDTENDTYQNIEEKIQSEIEIGKSAQENTVNTMNDLLEIN